MAENIDPSENKLENAPLNDKIADIVLKVLMTVGLAGGGISAFWSLFKESDVPKAIASAVIGLGISYAAKKLEKPGKAIDQDIDKAIDSATNQIITKASGFEDRYLECQKWDCQAVRSEGVAQYEGIFAPLLEEVFVPLALGTGAISAGFQFQDDEVDPKTDLNIWHFLARAEKEPTFKQLAILAWGGYGKTTLLKHIAYSYATQRQKQYGVPRRIPVLLAFRKYRELLSQATPPSLPVLVAQYHIPSLPEGADLVVPENWAQEILRDGKAIVMLDGFDEIPKVQRPAVARWVLAQMQRYRKSIFIVTARPKAYKDQDAGDRLTLDTQLWVQDFKPAQRKDFVQRWYFCQERYANGGRNTPDVQQGAQQAATELLTQIESRQELRDLAKNPLLLNMIATFHRRFPSAELPKQRVDLYKEICLLQLRDRPGARKLETVLTQCEAQIILQCLALYMMQQRLERVDRSTFLQLLNRFLTEQGEAVLPTDFLEQAVQISELLVEPEPDKFEFSHLSFQEYLAATHIAQQHQESLLYSHLAEDWWKPTILLYAAQTNPTSLIREMMNQDLGDLAFACLQETTKRLDAGLLTELNEFKLLKQAVRTSRYQQLEEYLKNGQWHDADKETYRLMITTVGQEEGQWFEEGILNFPCEELKAIDELWLKYSQGHFGFSVQKNIYLSERCGGIADGQHHKEAWDKFCHEIGWQKGGVYVSIQYDLTSLTKGYLPALLEMQNSGGGRGVRHLGETGSQAPVQWSLLSHPGL
jgi:predicted NACHT family NTPase